jgi:hypothetical protein
MLNVSRLFFTWHAHSTDGFEQFGFPLVFFERGGMSYQENWYYSFFIADICIALVLAYAAAQWLRDGRLARAANSGREELNDVG